MTRDKGHDWAPRPIRQDCRNDLWRDQGTAGDYLLSGINSASQKSPNRFWSGPWPSAHANFQESRLLCLYLEYRGFDLDAFVYNTLATSFSISSPSWAISKDAQRRPGGKSLFTTAWANMQLILKSPVKSGPSWFRKTRSCFCSWTPRKIACLVLYDFSRKTTKTPCSTTHQIEALRIHRDLPCSSSLTEMSASLWSKCGLVPNISQELIKELLKAPSIYLDINHYAEAKVRKGLERNATFSHTLHDRHFHTQYLYQGKKQLWWSRKSTNSDN